MRPLEDLQYILPQPLRNLASRGFLILLGITTLFGIVIIALVAVLAMHNASSGSSDEPQTGALSAAISIPPAVCITTTCLEVAAVMSKNMDPKVDPCDNFYQYACGGWIKNANVPPFWPDYNVMDDVRQDNGQRLVNIAFSDIRRKTAGSAERKMKQFYSMCKHDYGRMKEGGKALADIIKNDLGGWYVFDPDNWKNNWSVDSAMITSHTEMLVDALFTTWIYTDRRDRDQFIIRIREGGLGFSYYYYHREDRTHVMNAYKNYMKTVAGLMLRDTNITMPESRKQQVLQQFVDDAFTQEFRLAQAMKEGREAGDYYDLVEAPIRILMQNFTQIDWLGILRGIYGNDINSNTEVAVGHISYLTHMNQVLQNETTDRDRMMNNYIIWRVIDSYAHQLSWEYQVHSSSLLEAIYGYSYYLPSWQECLYTVERRMGVALASEVVRQHVGQNGKQQVESMVKALKDALEDMVKGFQWMDNVTLSRATEKVSKLDDVIGFSDDLLNEAYVDDVYADLVINKSLGYFKNLLNTNLYIKNAWRRQLKQDRKQWILELIESYQMWSSNPTLYSQYNKLIVPSGAIRMPFFVPDEPKFLDYGALGYKVGRVLISSVNNFGRNTWHNGSYWRWWTQKTYDEYREASNCFYNYIGNTTVGPYLVDGESVNVTLPRWAAYGILRVVPGLKMAYQAYQRIVDSDRHPPGLNRTNTQAFFIATAQTMCSKRSDEERYENAVSGFPREETYLNHALKHMPEFSDAFRCPKNKPMYLENKCKLY